MNIYKKINALLFLFSMSLLLCQEKAKQNQSVDEDNITITIKNYYPINNFLYKGSTISFGSPNILILTKDYLRPKKFYIKSKTDTVFTIKSKDYLSFNIRIQDSYLTYFLKKGDNLNLDFLDSLNIKKQTINNKNDQPFFLYNTDYKNFPVSNSITRFKALKDGKLDSFNESAYIEKYNKYFENKLVGKIVKSQTKDETYYFNNFLQLKKAEKIQDYNDDFLILHPYFVKIFQEAAKRYTNVKSPDFRKVFEGIYDSDDYPIKSKEFLLFEALNRIAESGSFKDLQHCYDLFLKVNNDLDLQNEFRKKYSFDIGNLKIEEKEVNLLTIQKKTKTLNQIIKENEGKIIYVDFWASWCLPCRKAMPSSRILKEKYAIKDIVFIYLSIDSDFDKWLLASKKEMLENYSYNYLILNYDKSEYLKILNVSAIPRYIIYDKEGKLVHKNAPSPEADNIEETLNLLLD